MKTITEEEFNNGFVTTSLIEPIETYLIDVIGRSHEYINSLTLVQDYQQWYDSDKEAILEYNRIYIKD